MYKKVITYKDYNEEERTDELYFDLSEAELTEMQLSKIGGLAEYLKVIIKSRDLPTLSKVFKDLLLKSYGEKGMDGKSFLKVDLDTGRPLSRAFSQTKAFSIIYMDILTNEESATAFLMGVVPKSVSEKMANIDVKTVLNE